MQKVNRRSNGQFEKGHQPWNKNRPHPHASKTMFKKGQKPFNFKEDGSERLDKDGYIVIKQGKWQLKHIVEYKRHYGELPKGYCVRFIDGNKRNFSKENLVAIPRGANMLLNSRRTNLSELGISEPVINLAYLQYLISVRSKKNERN